MTKTTRNDSANSLPLNAQQVSANVQGCWEKLEALAQAGWPDPRASGDDIVRAFRDHANGAELNELRARIKAECQLKPHVPVGHLREHQFWLAVLEGAQKAAE